MDLNELLTLLLKVVALLGSTFVVYLLPTVKTRIQESIGADKAAYIEQLITTFVISAEQTLQVKGEEKKAYVEAQLEELGIEVTDVIKALIEKAVVEQVNLGYTTPEVKKTTKKTTTK